MSKYGDNMLIVHSAWQGKKTFGLMPLNMECPYNEAILDPETKQLVIFMKQTKEAYHMVTKLDAYGEPIVDKMKNKVQQQRVKIETFSEHVLYEDSDIRSFIKTFAVNDNFDIDFYLKDKAIVAEKPKSKLIVD